MVVKLLQYKTVNVLVTGTPQSNCRHSTNIMLTASKRFLTNRTNLFRMQGLKIMVSKIIVSGPIRVEIRVVSHGDRLNHDSNQPCWASLSIFLKFSWSLSSAMESLTTPVWSA